MLLPKKMMVFLVSAGVDGVAVVAGLDGVAEVASDVSVLEVEDEFLWLLQADSIRMIGQIT